MGLNSGLQKVIFY